MEDNDTLIEHVLDEAADLLNLIAGSSLSESDEIAALVAVNTLTAEIYDLIAEVIG